MSRKKPIIDTEGYCAPSAVRNYRSHKSCFDKIDLTNIAEVVQVEIASEKSLQTIYTEILGKLQCKDDTCVVQKLNGTVDNLYKKLRPVMRESWLITKDEWLNNIDIDKVMYQYEEFDSKFKYLGTVPLDFSEQVRGYCVSQNICTFSLHEFLNQGKDSFGLVINLDTHNKSGSHWVSLYASFKTDGKFGCVFFDSSGAKPPKLLIKFIRKITTQAQDIFKNKTFDTWYNQTRYQNGGTECGMFSMVSLIKCIEHTSHDFHSIKDFFDKWKLSDDDVFHYRKLLYRPPIKVTKNNIKN
jgi:hypothetical protein